MNTALVLAGATLIVLLPVLSIVFWRRRTARSRGRAVQRVAFVLLTVFSAMASLFIAGEAVDDPGGAAGVRLVLSWLVPLALLVALAGWAPRWSGWIFGVLAAVVVAAIGLIAAVPALRLIEHRTGPVRAVAVFVIAAALGVLGLKRTRLAGWLLIAVGIEPVAIAIVGSRLGGQPLLAVSVLPLITGLLYLLAAGLINAERGSPGSDQPHAAPVTMRGTADGVDK